MDKRLEEFVLRDLKDLKGNSSKATYLDEPLGSFCHRMKIDLSSISLKEMNRILKDNLIEQIPSEVVFVYNVEYSGIYAFIPNLKRRFFLDAKLLSGKKGDLRKALINYTNSMSMKVDNLEYEFIATDGLKEKCLDLIGKVENTMEQLSEKDAHAVANALLDVASPYLTTYDLELNLNYLTQVDDIMTLSDLLKKKYNRISLTTNNGTVLNIFGENDVPENISLQTKVRIIGYNRDYNVDYLTVEAKEEVF